MRKLRALALVSSIGACLILFQNCSKMSAIELSPTSANSANPPSAQQNFSPAWQDGNMGAGGNVDDIAIYPDGTKIARTDTNGFYIWNGSTWNPLGTFTSLPTNFINQFLLGLNPIGGTEIGACAYTTSSTKTLVGTTSTLYAQFATEVFKSTDKGATWLDTGLSIATPGGNQSPVGGSSPWVWCDPASNGQVVYISQPTGAVLRSVNGGMNWSSISGPAAATSNNGSLIIGDVNAAVVNGVTQTIYVYVQGTGLYVSTNGGSTWTLTNGGPNLTGARLYIDQFSQVWLVANSTTTIFKYAGGVWSTITNVPFNGNVTSLGLDPNSTSASTQHIVAMRGSGTLAISNDGGATWAGGSYTEKTGGLADVTWLASTVQAGGSNQPIYLDANNVAFDLSGNLFVAAGYGVWYISAPVPASGAVYNAQSAGIEQLVVNRIISPPGLGPTVVNWDKGIFGDLLPGTYATIQYPSVLLNGSWDVAYVPGTPTTLVAVVNGEGGGDNSGISTDGGNTWKPFASLPNGTSQQGGMIAADSATDIIIVPGQGQVPYCSTDGGATWKTISFPGSPANNWLGNYYLTRHVLASDSVNAGVLYAYNGNYSGQGQLFRSSGGCGGTWTQVHGTIDSNSMNSIWNAKLETVPGKAGHLFYTSGPVGCGATVPCPETFHRSIDGGTTWTDVPNVMQVTTFGFGAAKPGGNGYPTIYLQGYVNVAGTWTYGNWQSVDNAATWTELPLWSPSSIDPVGSMVGDPDVYGRLYMGYSGGAGYAYYDTSDACPWVGFTSPKPNASLTGNVTLTAAHSGLVPVGSVQFSVDGNNIGSALTGNGPYTISWNASSVSAGLHKLTVTVTGGNCNSSKTIPITTR
jgi:hypothetical protein